MKILVTGGHFSPALSVISDLRRRGCDISVAGRRYAMEGDKIESLEYKICKEENVQFFNLVTGRIQRRLTPHTLFSLAKIPYGLAMGLKIVKGYKPDVILTFGGYLGVPISLAAYFSGVPIVMHESTQGAGLAAKFISRLAAIICVGYRSSEKYFPPRKTVFTGNPIRQEVFRVETKFPDKLPDGKKVIYVTGGSTGAHIINSAISEILIDLLSDYVVIHQSGDSSEFGDYEKLKNQREELPSAFVKRYFLKQFILPSEIGFVLKSADLIISRAGANITAEIMALGKISLLIPLSQGQRNEQLENARLIKNLGIGEYISEDDLNSSDLLTKVKEMLSSPRRYIINMDKASEYVKSDSAKQIADQVFEVYGKKGIKK